jgi:hypothetical protein
MSAENVNAWWGWQDSNLQPDRYGLTDDRRPSLHGWYAGAGKANIVTMQDWLRLIEGSRRSREPRAGRRRSLDQSEQVTCWKCENERGIATSRFRKAVICPRRDPDGKIRGGTQVWVCDYCGTKIAPVK